MEIFIRIIPMYRFKNRKEYILNYLIFKQSELQENDGDILRLGLLQEVGGDSMSLRKKEIFVSFQHKTMQEFVAAEYVAINVNESADKKQKIEEFFRKPENLRQVNLVSFCAILIEDTQLFVERVRTLCVTLSTDATKFQRPALLNKNVLDSVSKETELNLFGDVVQEIIQDCGKLHLTWNTLTGLLPELLPAHYPLTPLQELNLCDTQLDTSDFEHLVSLIRHNKLPGIRRLLLSLNTLTGLLPKFRLDSPLQSLEHLDLNSTGLDKSDVEHLTSIILEKKLPSLQRLALWRNNLCDVESECGQLIGCCVTHHQRGLVLILWYNNLSPQFKDVWAQFCSETNVKIII